jgi:hypothetical protein
LDSNLSNKNKVIKIAFVDSLNLLNSSLAKLSNDFDIEIKKGYFPYDFVKPNTLNYIGDIPDIKYYNDIDIRTYNSLIKNYKEEFFSDEKNKEFEFSFSLKNEALKYLDKDLKSLLEIINYFSSELYINYNVLLTESLTITRLALNIFLKNYYNSKDRIPLINKFEIFNFIKEGYYGGITEVYKPYGKNLTYIDINSLYPYAALNDMPGIECNYEECFDNETLNLDNLFGFYYAEIDTKNSKIPYLGLLPVHSQKGIISPSGKFTGI